MAGREPQPLDTIKQVSFLCLQLAGSKVAIEVVVVEGVQLGAVARTCGFCYVVDAVPFVVTDGR